jgi:6-pyruvoyltetrahydropterin/6-carboxytetrahydropterin synthase
MIFRLEIDGWKSGIRFSSAHILPGHKKCEFLHGHTYVINAKIYGNKDRNDFIMDFSIVKSSLKKIADSLDHKILIPKTNTFFEFNDRELKVAFGGKKYVFPREDCAILPISSTTAENLAIYVLKELQKIIDIPSNVKKIEIGVDEGFGQGAWIEKVMNHNKRKKKK